MPLDVLGRTRDCFCASSVTLTLLACTHCYIGFVIHHDLQLARYNEYELGNVPRVKIKKTNNKFKPSRHYSENIPSTTCDFRLQKPGSGNHCERIYYTDSWLIPCRHMYSMQKLPFDLLKTLPSL